LVNARFENGCRGSGIGDQVSEVGGKGIIVQNVHGDSEKLREPVISGVHLSISTHSDEGLNQEILLSEN
jgi:hypothetical protein